MAAGKQPEIPAALDPSSGVKKPMAVNAGANGGRVVDHQDDVERAQSLARRYRFEFVDLRNFQLQHDLFRKIPVQLMFNSNFIPLEELPDGRLAIAIADPSQLAA